MMSVFVFCLLAALVSLIFFLISLRQVKVGEFYADVPWFFPFGVYVWGDGVILFPFWVISFLFLAFQTPLNVARYYLFFLIIRSGYEVLYWLNHQAVRSEYIPPLFKRLKWLKANESAILYQLAHFCVVVALGGLLAATWFVPPSIPSSIDALQELSAVSVGHLKDRSIITASIQGTQQAITLEVVNTPVSITQGLSGRASIGADGMLFVFNQTFTPQFWMKEMRFPLDLIWILDGTIVEVTRNVPAPKNAIDPLPKYSPTQAINMVLEVEAGNADKWGLLPGKKLQLP